MVEKPGSDRRDAGPRSGAVRAAVIIPALNEERSLPLVLKSLSELRPASLRDGRRIELAAIIVVDNGSTDATAEVAAGLGATVLSEPRRGYGRACLTGLAHLEHDPPDIVVFLDADFSDDPSLMFDLVRPIADGEQDFVLGSRLIGRPEPGAMPPQARYGNAMSVTFIRLLYGFSYTDLGPFRAISFPCLRALGMRDETFGWTAEMQVKALLARLRVHEIPVPYRRRVGSSKITGTVSGTVKAGAKILWTILKYRVAPERIATRARGPS